MARHTPQVKLDLQRARDDRDALIDALSDMLAIIKAQGLQAHSDLYRARITKASETLRQSQS